MTRPDHGGDLDAAMARYGGTRTDWMDLSTGINPVPYPVPTLPDTCWTRLPEATDDRALIAAARAFWAVPDTLDIVPAGGASALIALLPGLWPKGIVAIRQPTYNEHARAFRAHGWSLADSAPTRVVVQPNNPDGRLWSAGDLAGRERAVIDESFCDVCPDRSLIALADRPDHVVLKSFGKFWGLAGLRLGFAICRPDLAARFRDRLGPWAVSGPAIWTGRIALADTAWAERTRARLAVDASRLDRLATGAGLARVGGTDLFATYRTGADWHERLARAHIWTRVFPYDDWLIRIGLPRPDDWPRLEQAFADPTT